VPEAVHCGNDADVRDDSTRAQSRFIGFAYESGERRRRVTNAAYLQTTPEQQAEYDAVLVANGLSPYFNTAPTAQAPSA
jgi:hypothetical protein